jgi:hypothetical protein
MDSSDAMQIMKAIGDNHADIKQDLGDLRAEFSLFKGGAHERIKELEHEVKTTEKRQWTLTYVVVPTLGVIHAIANYLGVKV